MADATWNALRAGIEALREYTDTCEALDAMEAALAAQQPAQGEAVAYEIELRQLRARAEAAEARYAALCEAEPVAWAVASNANGFTELRRAYPERGDGVFREDVDLRALINRPVMEGGTNE